MVDLGDGTRQVVLAAVEAAVGLEQQGPLDGLVDHRGVWLVAAAEAGVVIAQVQPGSSADLEANQEVLPSAAKVVEREPE